MSSKHMKLVVLKNLAQPFYLFIMIGTAVLMFDFQYYFMMTLGGSVNKMCVVGGDLTAANVWFAVVFSLLTGVMAAALVALFKAKRKKVAASSSLSGLGVILASLTVFCAVCTVPVLTVFGFSLSLGFFSTYNIAIKILSVIFMLGGLYMVNKQLEEECKICHT